MLSQCFVRCISTLLILHMLLFSSASPLMKHMVEELLEESSLHPRQNSGNETFAITGVQTFGIQPRLEIRELQNNADQWNLYMLGLTRMMAVDQDDKLSYYQIAGLHGRPYIPWDGVEGAPGIVEPGYCTHVSNLFLPWHRPYLALYEQVLYRHVTDAVNAFPAGALRSRYARAALSFRMPYWDWAASPPDGGSVYPQALQIERIDVEMPNGTQTIDNPLFAYRFHPVSRTDFYFDTFGSWNQTLRSPTTQGGDARSQNALIGRGLDSNRVSLQDRLYNIFTSLENFTQFSNEAWTSSSADSPDSVESLHDVIHGVTGGGGHMTYLDFSAYDPVFWLHHTMIDRVFALFQNLHSESYVDPLPALQNTFTIPEGTILDVDTPLQPFHSDTDGNFYTSRTARRTDTFGYTYPELANNANSSAVRSAINRLYGSSAGSSSLSRRSLPAPQGKQRQYQANVLSQKHALNGSYAIYLFMGDAPATSSEWSTAPNLVGTHAVFGALTSDQATQAPWNAIRTHDKNVIVTGTIPLTSTLVDKVVSGELACLEEADVEAYLKQQLTWRVAMFDNSIIPPSAVGNLEISIATAEVEPAADEGAFPSWGDFKTLTAVTQGKPGGCS
ncbi:hypothetical protein MBLNU230_g7835t1 [Neophaeotheca triangularis]